MVRRANDVIVLSGILIAADTLAPQSLGNEVNLLADNRNDRTCTDATTKSCVIQPGTVAVDGTRSRKKR